MNIESITFIKERIATHAKVSELLMNEIKLDIGQEGLDFINELHTTQLSAFILSHLNETKTITIYKERPTFLDWLFRRRRSFTFEFNCKEVLKNPLLLPPHQSALMYSVKEQE